MAKREWGGLKIPKRRYIIRFIKRPAFQYSICLSEAMRNDFMKQYNFEDVINKAMTDKILVVIKEKKRIKAIEVANLLGAIDI